MGELLKHGGDSVIWLLVFWALVSWKLAPWLHDRYGCDDPHCGCGGRL